MPSSCLHEFPLATVRAHQLSHLDPQCQLRSHSADEGPAAVGPQKTASSQPGDTKLQILVNISLCNQACQPSEAPPLPLSYINGASAHSSSSGSAGLSYNTAHLHYSVMEAHSL